MFTVLVVLAVVIGILLILLVISQKSKGGGLASSFSSSNQVLGVRKTTDFVEKATWTLVAIMVVLCIASAAFMPNKVNTTTGGVKEYIGTQPTQQAGSTSANVTTQEVPATPAETPAE